MKDNRMQKTLVSLFFVVILIASTAGFVVTFRQPDNTSYNGYEFEQRDGQWITEVETSFGTEEFSFYNHPLNLDVVVGDDILQSIRTSPSIVLLFDPNVTDIHFVDAARFQLKQYLVNQLGKNVEHAVTTNSTLYPFPVQQCSGEKLFIIYSSGDNRTLAKEGNCITMTSYSSSDFLQYSEAIVYRLLGVIA
ncbi:hypothetical protein J4207_03695 [Candidatus Woesearchaeota archaeon]|nr:hypothetical protein [Candidatus Woesearchaeota archaeon]